MSMAPLLAAMQNTSMFDPVSPPAESIRNVSILAFAVTGCIFVVVEGVLLYCLLRFRRGRAAGTAEPPQVYGSNPIEIAWTVGPVLIVFVLVLVTTRVLWEINVDPPSPRVGDNALFVTVVGRQWWWEYTYDHYNGRELGFTTANELHVPAGDGNAARPVYLTLMSADVCHSFWVPRLAGKTDLIPGRTNHMWFQTSAPGLYVGQCAEFCGRSTPTCCSEWPSIRPTSLTGGWITRRRTRPNRPRTIPRRRKGRRCSSSNRASTATACAASRTRRRTRRT